MVKLSIIVPVYNVYDYIDQCLNSLVNQTLKDIEIIVVNDGSLDNSQDIIDKYEKKYPKLIRSFVKVNEGQGSARNLGLDYANGKYVTFIDSDDYIDANFGLDLVNKLEEEQSDVAICDIVDHYNNNEIYHDCTNFKYIYEKTPSVCNKIFRIELFKDIRFKNKFWYEDLNIMYKLLPYFKKISIIKKGYYHCNCREISTMNNNNSLKNLDIIEMIDDAKKYLIQINKFDYNVYSYIVFQNILVDTINRVEAQKNDAKNNVIKTLRNYCKDNISDYKKQEFYKDISRNRKIVAYLNYIGLNKISKILINIKK